MDEFINSIENSKIFSRLYAKSRLYQVPIRKEDRDNTAFNFRTEIFRYDFMPFGLTNTPMTTALNPIISNFKWEKCLYYLDDVIVYLNSIEDHFFHV